MTTEDDEKLIHLAMEKANGVKSVAAKLLNMEPTLLANRIAQNKNLKLRWVNGKKNTQPPSEAVTIHRPVMASDEDVGEVILSEAEIAQQLAREDKSIRAGMGDMGLGEKELDLARACQTYHKKHFRSVIDGVSGGIFRQFMKILVQIDKIDERLADSDSEYPLLLPEEMMLREDRSRLLVIVGQYKDKVDKSVLIQAKIMALDKKKKPNSEKPKGYLDLKQANGALDE